MVYARIEQTLTTALTYVGRVHDLYRLSGPQVRRYANQYFFEMKRPRFDAASF